MSHKPPAFRDLLPKQGLRWPQRWVLGKQRRDYNALLILEKLLPPDGRLRRNVETKTIIWGALVEVFDQATALALQRPYGTDEELFIHDLSLRTSIGQHMGPRIFRSLFHTTIRARSAYFTWCFYANANEVLIQPTDRCPLSEAVDRWRQATKDMDLGKLDSMVEAQDALEQGEEGANVTSVAVSSLGDQLEQMRMEGHEGERSGSPELVLSHDEYEPDDDDEENGSEDMGISDEEDEEGKKMNVEEMIVEATEVMDAMDLDD
ncbi:hypothetical protein QBC43DRAFT_293442 [Cladorrhinum sp. PSN259]|nr:hypothetical protein QBC43DRAFT_293442 [Cladorrhinum sp. PSN259]